ncbi:MAG: DUF2301 domain-containing membrane protein [Synechococcales bacterium]|nr:DUF2301 domain-containing membrane protein [Synechococcales bacterium]
MTSSVPESEPHRIEQAQPELYQGQFGPFTITAHDRREVIYYRSGLAIAALCFAIATALIFIQKDAPWLGTALSLLYGGFVLALGGSLITIHIYLASLHRLLQIFWGIGAIASLAIVLKSSEPLAIAVYAHPVLLLGVGFTFAALTGIFFKEAFCFNRLETKLLTPIVPLLLVGHLLGIMPVGVEKTFLGLWAVLMLVFACRKAVQPIPPDIGDKSVFTYLREQKGQRA